MLWPTRAASAALKGVKVRNGDRQVKGEHKVAHSNGSYKEPTIYNPPDDAQVILTEQCPLCGRHIPAKVTRHIVIHDGIVNQWDYRHDLRARVCVRCSSDLGPDVNKPVFSS